GSLLFPGVWQAYPATLKLACPEQVSANRYVTMVIYQKLLPRTKKRGVFYLSLKIRSLNRLASYDEYPPAPTLTCLNKKIKTALFSTAFNSSVGFMFVFVILAPSTLIYCLLMINYARSSSTTLSL